MKTEILKIKGGWQEVVDDCRTTVGKDSLGKEPSREFKRDILISEHSPIRSISVRWMWKNIKSWVATHWCRHKWECYIKTQRTDRTGVNRDELPQSAPVDFKGEANVQHLIDTMRKRLCYQASWETRDYAEDLKTAIKKVEPEISDVLVPNCVYRCGCPETNCCGVWSMFTSWALKKYNIYVEMLGIHERYRLYNEWFYTVKRGGENND